MSVENGLRVDPHTWFGNVWISVAIIKRISFKEFLGSTKLARPWMPKNGTMLWPAIALPSGAWICGVQIWGRWGSKALDMTWSQTTALWWKAWMLADCCMSPCMVAMVQWWLWVRIIRSKDSWDTHTHTRHICQPPADSAGLMAGTWKLKLEREQLCLKG